MLGLNPAFLVCVCVCVCEGCGLSLKHGNAFVLCDGPKTLRPPTSLLVFLCRHCHLAKASHCKLATKWLRQMGYVIKCGYSNCMYASLHVVSQYTCAGCVCVGVFGGGVCIGCVYTVCVAVYLALPGPGTVSQNERSQPSVAALCLLRV